MRVKRLENDSGIVVFKMPYESTQAVLLRDLNMGNNMFAAAGNKYTLSEDQECRLLSKVCKLDDLNNSVYYAWIMTAGENPVFLEMLWHDYMEIVNDIITFEETEDLLCLLVGEYVMETGKQISIKDDDYFYHPESRTSWT